MGFKKYAEAIRAMPYEWIVDSTKILITPSGDYIAITEHAPPVKYNLKYQVWEEVQAVQDYGADVKHHFSNYYSSAIKGEASFISKEPGFASDRKEVEETTCCICHSHWRTGYNEENHDNRFHSLYDQIKNLRMKVEKYSRRTK